MPDETDTAARSDGRLRAADRHAQAEALLVAVRAGEADALERFHCWINPSSDQLTLEASQTVVALESGFADWAGLMRHIEALDAAARNATLNGDRDITTLHIRCGSDIRNNLQAAGFTGTFLEFADPFCMGPVPALPLPQHLRRRAEFIAAAFDMDTANVLARLEQEYAGVECARDFWRIALWSEHDSYDQLILAFVLQRLGEVRPGGLVELIAVDRVPGVQRFVGLGQLAPDVLAWLWERRIGIGPAQFELGARIWDALRAEAPTALHAIALSGTPAVPTMAPALLRHLRELPDLRTGLGLTETLTLEILRDRGPLTLASVYGILMREREPLPHLGDTMFRWIARRLAHGPTPLLFITPEPASPDGFDDVVDLTEIGHNVLQGTLSRLDLSPPERWVGGVASPGASGDWCWDEDRSKPVWRGQ